MSILEIFWQLIVFGSISLCTIRLYDYIYCYNKDIDKDINNIENYYHNIQEHIDGIWFNRLQSIDMKIEKIEDFIKLPRSCQGVAR